MFHFQNQRVYPTRRDTKLYFRASAYRFERLPRHQAFQTSFLQRSRRRNREVCTQESKTLLPDFHFFDTSPLHQAKNSSLRPPVGMRSRCSWSFEDRRKVPPLS